MPILKTTPWERESDNGTPVVHDAPSADDRGQLGLRAKLF